MIMMSIGIVVVVMAVETFVSRFSGQEFLVLSLPGARSQYSYAQCGAQQLARESSKHLFGVPARGWLLRLPTLHRPQTRRAHALRKEYNAVP